MSSFVNSNEFFVNFIFHLISLQLDTNLSLSDDISYWRPSSPFTKLGKNSPMI